MADTDSWLEISLRVDGELAEAVAEVLSRDIPAGVVIESAPAPASSSSAVPAEELLYVYGYLPNDDALAARRQRIEQGLWHLGRISPLPQPDYRLIQEADWSHIWREQFQPIRIGERLLVQPSWVPAPGRDGRIALRIDPGMAFGTGTHPTTQLALAMVESGTRPGFPLIDVGCGSGILAIAGLKLGASRALAVDTDPLAMREAEKNARLNRVKSRLALRLGSVAEIREGRAGLRRAPLVAANIVAPVLTQLLSQGLADLVSSGGMLVLSGMLDGQEYEVAKAAENAGLKLHERSQDGDWVALACRASSRIRR
jgi:ribosomal protein L11 methyltransferase